MHAPYRHGNASEVKCIYNIFKGGVDNNLKETNCFFKKKNTHPKKGTESLNITVVAK